MYLQPFGESELIESDFDKNSNKMPWVLVEFTVVEEFSPSPRRRSHRKYDDDIPVEVEEGLNKSLSLSSRPKSIGASARNQPPAGDNSIWSQRTKSVSKSYITEKLESAYENVDSQFNFSWDLG